jgi:hypothetical protein
MVRVVPTMVEIREEAGPHDYREAKKRGHERKGHEERQRRCECTTDGERNSVSMASAENAKTSIRMA